MYLFLYLTQRTNKTRRVSKIGHVQEALSDEFGKDYFVTWT